RPAIKTAWHRSRRRRSVVVLNVCSSSAWSVAVNVIRCTLLTPYRKVTRPRAIGYHKKDAMSPAVCIRRSHRGGASLAGGHGARWSLLLSVFPHAAACGPGGAEEAAAARVGAGHQSQHVY